ncbi:hypothetical protein C3Y89_24185 [Rhizobium sp. UPM1132]|nr:hypothetical protein [Rhizobium ruizarguesonis]
MDRFPKGFDPVQHGLLRTLYGDFVPLLESIRVRAGWYGIVDEMFARLGRLRNRRDFRVLSVATRGAGNLVVETKGNASDVPDIIHEAHEAAYRTCEHCGQPSRLVVKVGLEALLSSPDIELGDRLLCVDCADEFMTEIGL